MARCGHPTTSETAGACAEASRNFFQQIRSAGELQLKSPTGNTSVEMICNAGIIADQHDAS
jgi:hypothetical protein